MACRRTCSGLVAAVLAATVALSCGGGSSGAGDGEVLFDGSADDLLPHPTGRSASFRVTATQDGASDVSSFTSTVTGNAADGTFVTRYVSATGAVAESTSRDSGDAIVVERFVNDPGGAGEEVVTPEPPVGVVRTPVVAGEPIESSFARTLELELRVGGTVERRQVLFVGSARRVPRERGAVSVLAGTYPDAIRYAVEARGETRIPVLGESVTVDVQVAGDEWFAPGVGGVKEDLEVTVRAADERAVIRFVTEREGMFHEGARAPSPCAAEPRRDPLPALARARPRAARAEVRVLGRPAGALSRPLLRTRRGRARRAARGASPCRRWSSADRAPAPARAAA